MYVDETEVEAVGAGMKKFLLVPQEGNLRVKEIRQLRDDQQVFAVLTEIEAGTLDHWLHDKKLLQDYGCAQPHELAEYLKQKYGKIHDANQVWLRVELVRVPEWAEVSVKEIRSGLFRLLFRLKTENRI